MCKEDTDSDSYRRKESILKKRQLWEGRHWIGSWSWSPFLAAMTGSRRNPLCEWFSPASRRLQLRQRTTVETAAAAAGMGRTTAAASAVPEVGTAAWTPPLLAGPRLLLPGTKGPPRGGLSGMCSCLGIWSTGYNFLSFSFSFYCYSVSMC